MLGSFLYSVGIHWVYIISQALLGCWCTAEIILHFRFPCGYRLVYQTAFWTFLFGCLICNSNITCLKTRSWHFFPTLIVIYKSLSHQLVKPTSTQFLRLNTWKPSLVLIFLHVPYSIQQLIYQLYFQNIFFWMISLSPQFTPAVVH